MNRSMEDRLRTLEKQVSRLAPAGRLEIADFMAAWRPPPKPELSVEERLAALERALLPTPKTD